MQGELGRGAWGIVLAGRHKSLNRDVAIKQLPPEFGADPSVRSRFRSEARMLAALEHPHIVPIYDFVEHEGLCLLVMERLTGGTVWNRARTGGFTLESSCAVIVAACAALHYAHAHGVLHRDVKPENMMFSSKNVLKVTDFGIAKVVGGAATVATRAGDVLGTPAYMAPEQAMGAELTPATDVYAVGTVMYQLLSGRLPFPEDTNPITMLYRHVHELPEPLSKAAPHVPRQLADVTAKALEPDPANRYGDAEVLAVALASACADIWGPEWMTDTDMAITASGPVLQAATGRATLGGAMAQAQAADETIGPLPREVPVLGASTGDLVPVSVLDPSLAAPSATGPASGPLTADAPITEPTPSGQAAAAAGPMTIDAPSVTPPAVTPPPMATPMPAPAGGGGAGGGGGRRVALILGIVLIVAAAAVAIVVATSKKSSPPKPLVAGVTVSGTEPFTDTGVDLKQGDLVTITATGKVRPSITDPNVFATPDGVANRPDLRQYNVIPNVNHSGLMGWIGDNGAPFQVGSRKVFTAPKTGRLFFGINDKGVENNDGQFQATITVKTKK
ncbi:MAG: serine/threonine protein kinase [Actinobacteria bacterium]|nr:serine/threonine protein kinase [Actinomycetota bacterium]